MIKAISLTFSTCIIERKGDISGCLWKVPQGIVLGHRNRGKHWKKPVQSMGLRITGVSFHQMPLGQRLSYLCMPNASWMFDNKKEVITTLIN